MSAILETVGVGRKYGDFVALEDVSLSIAEGELVSIVGPNGAGKTTLVNVLTGLLKPTAGLVRFRGQDIAGIGPVMLARRGMARAFQLVHIFPAMTVGQTISVAVISRQGKGLRFFSAVVDDLGVRERVREVASIFGLEKKLEELADSPELLAATTMSISAWQRGIHAWIDARTEPPRKPTLN